ncbi:DNA/RNA non-specific endonuclease [Vagococcus carniphilus]|uniref:DNA/RNA non-specific endonuclease n=1 Tax=Vagococcus carniphilus TaxID=218144 RepID=UPI00288D5022|nr:DNA/RNA non-specific endonuclease [Vagococcus carniphilus]MDT2814164.1 DNA/RNA non-specific endonuclease [Vagococcus carniphilus]
MKGVFKTFDLEREITKSIGNVNLNYQIDNVKLSDYQKYINDIQVGNIDHLKVKNEESSEIINLQDVLIGGTKSSVKKKIRNKIICMRGTDDSCHLIARCLGGTNQQVNLFAGTRTLNRAIMNHVEKVVKNFIETTHSSVFYRVELVHGVQSQRVKKIKIIIVPLNSKDVPVKVEILNI